MSQSSTTFGILGGAGPLASAQFVSDIYNDSSCLMPEQARPCVVAIHEPRLPDRTKAIQTGTKDALVFPLKQNLDLLLGLGCQQILVACFTIHSVFPLLPDTYRTVLIDLFDTIRTSTEVNRRYLVLCTNGSRHERLFDRAFSDRPHQICFPNSPDQDAVHELIYRLKAGERPDVLWPEMASIVAGYDVQGVIAGCTEIYLLRRQLADFCLQRNWHPVDALGEWLAMIYKAQDRRADDLHAPACENWTCKNND